MNLNKSNGLISDGFTAAIDEYSFGGDVYVKEGPSTQGGATTNCPASSGRYVVGYVVTETFGGIQNTEDALEIYLTVPREAASGTVILRQRRYPDGGSDWRNIAFRSAGIAVTSAVSIGYAGTTAQCGENLPCYATIQHAVNYVTNSGSVNVMGAFVEKVNIARNVTLQSGSPSASLTASGSDAITVQNGDVVIKNLAIIADPSFSAIRIDGGNVKVKGNTIDVNNSTAFECGSGILNAYANNLFNVVNGVSGSGCTVNLEHNFWGVYDGSGPSGLSPDDWTARLGNVVEAYSDATFTIPGGSVTLNGAALGGGTGTAVIVSHGKNYPPFGNGITPYINSMCGDYYDFFVRGGNGNWYISMPVDDNVPCNTNVLAPQVVFRIDNIDDCA